MTHLTRRSLILIAALAGIAQSAYGQICVTSGTDGNTACGTFALENGYSDGGYSNSAFGISALQSNTSGFENTASGAYALAYNTTGSQNTASGYQALYSTTTGIEDTGVGYGALHTNTTGKENTAFGNEALYAVTTGANNIAMGFHAGIDLTSGSNDIDIGNAGVTAESGVIRIGTAGTQTKTFVAGIENSKVTGAAVYVTSSGQIGVLASSERYKTAIAPMGANTQKLRQLRPVTFRLKTDPEGAVQYGLIAEEVDKIYPELVIRDDQGKIQGVRYDELAPMLLNEMQEQQQKLAAEDATLKLQADKVAALTAQSEEQSAEIRGLKTQLAELNDLKQELRAALPRVQSKDQLVAQR
jgi:trimeric autotransporter adhesin